MIKTFILFAIINTKSVTSPVKTVENPNPQNIIDDNRLEKVKSRDMDFINGLLSYKKTFFDKIGRDDLKATTDEEIFYMYYDVHKKINEWFELKRSHFKDDINKIVDKKVKYENLKVSQTIIERYEAMKNLANDMTILLTDLMNSIVYPKNLDNDAQKKINLLKQSVNIDEINNSVNYIFKESINGFLREISIKIYKANDNLKYKEVDLFENSNISIIFRNNTQAYEDMEIRIFDFLQSICKEFIRYLIELRDSINEIEESWEINRGFITILDEYILMFDNFSIKNIENNKDIYEIRIQSENLLIRGVQTLKKAIVKSFIKFMGKYFRKSVEYLFDIL